MPDRSVLQTRMTLLCRNEFNLRLEIRTKTQSNLKLNLNIQSDWQLCMVKNTIKNSRMSQW